MHIKSESIARKSRHVGSQHWPDGVMDTADIIFRAALVGIGGTIVLDLYALLMQRMFGVPAGNCPSPGAAALADLRVM